MHTSLSDLQQKKNSLQEIFKEASHEMERCKKLIEATFSQVIEVTESSELTPQKVLNLKTFL